MKTTIDIPIKELEDVVKYTSAKTKREAVVYVISEYNRRARMAQLSRHAGTCDDLISPEELQQLRRKS